MLHCLNQSHPLFSSPKFALLPCPFLLPYSSLPLINFSKNLNHGIGLSSSASHSVTPPFLFTMYVPWCYLNKVLLTYFQSVIFHAVPSHAYNGYRALPSQRCDTLMARRHMSVDLWGVTLQKSQNCWTRWMDDIKAEFINGAFHLEFVLNHSLVFILLEAAWISFLPGACLHTTFCTWFGGLGSWLKHMHRSQVKNPVLVESTMT